VYMRVYIYIYLGNIVIYDEPVMHLTQIHHLDYRSSILHHPEVCPYVCMCVYMYTNVNIGI
jgi:hypothetical protein